MYLYIYIYTYNDTVVNNENKKTIEALSLMIIQRIMLNE